MKKLLPVRGAAFLLGAVASASVFAWQGPPGFDPVNAFLGPGLLRHLGQQEVLPGKGEHYRMFWLPSFHPAEVVTLDVLPDGSGEVHHRIARCAMESDCTGAASDQVFHVSPRQVDAFRTDMARMGLWKQQRTIEDGIADGVAIIVDGASAQGHIRILRMSLCPGEGKPLATFERVLQAFDRLQGKKPEPFCRYS
ncbi:MAG: hypothetical protein AB1832_09775 [Pseudomonadota bacterium]